jgi:hypothetical protein
MKTRFILVTALMLAAILYTNANAETYYLTSTGAASAQNLSSWNTNPNGSGTQPSNFITPGDVFIIPSGITGIISGNWTIGQNVTLNIIGILNFIKNSNATFTINGTIIFPENACMTTGGGQNKSTLILSSGATLKTANTAGIYGNNCSIYNSKIRVILDSAAVYEFNGTSAQNTLGLPSFVNTLVINNPAGVNLSANVTVTKSINLTSGILKTGSYAVTFSAGADNPVETSGSRILGTAVMSARKAGTSSVSFLNASMLAGADVGSVTITRTTGTSISVGNNSGINSIWSISVTNTASSRQMEFNWLTVYDNGNVFSSTNKAQIYKSADGKGSWVPSGNSTDVSTTNPRKIYTNESPSMSWTVSSADAPLPVALESFTSNVNGRNVTLKWSTSSEVNNAGFEIERKAAGGDYVKAGFIGGKGTVSTQTTYTFTDKNLASGSYSYRLKQTDYNGSYEYFTLSGNVTVGIPSKFDLSQNYPNPFNPSTKINFDLPKYGQVSLKIYDMLGREVSTLVSEFRTAGYYSVDFNASSLTSGVYFYRVSTGDFSAVKKMTVLK